MSRITALLAVSGLLLAGFLAGRLTAPVSPIIVLDDETQQGSANRTDIPGFIEAAKLGRQHPQVNEKTLAVPNETLAEEIRKYRENLPTELLHAQIEKVTGIAAERLASTGDPEHYVDRLLDVALSGTVEPALAETPVFGPISFSRAGSTRLPVSEFSASDKVIYANFSTTGRQSSDALVKWIHLDTGQPMMFKSIEVGSKAESFVWIRNFNGFLPGNYLVELYDVDTLELLTAGQYLVR